MVNETHVLGLMSGSSLDGLDLALCKFEGDTIENLKWECLATTACEFPKKLVSDLRRATAMNAKELFELDVLFSRFCAEQIQAFQASSEHPIDYIASHGHTVYHHPELEFTTQLGKGSLLAELTGITAITDFRSNDIAQGGQGAPLAPIVEQWLYPDADLYINLGGIANVSLHSRGEIVSFDSCPCNQVLNMLASERDLEYDNEGALARQGQVNEDLLDQSLEMDYMAFPAPKSLDNSWVVDIFGPMYTDQAIPLEDRLATMTEFIAIQLALDIKRMIAMNPTDKYKVMVTGGGAHNDFLMESMSDQVGANISIFKPDNLTINYKEAILMALMGYLRVKEIPNTIPSVTGAKTATVGGTVWLAS